MMVLPSSLFSSSTCSFSSSSSSLLVTSSSGAKVCSLRAAGEGSSRSSTSGLRFSQYSNSCSGLTHNELMQSELL